MIVVYDFDDAGEGYFDYLAVGAFHFEAGLGERLRGLHAADYAPHAAAVVCDYLYVVFPVKGLERCKGFCNFHFFFLFFGRFPATLRMPVASSIPRRIFFILALYIQVDASTEAFSCQTKRRASHLNCHTKATHHSIISEHALCE
jgi:hypothetical protein